ncbi:MAG: phosphatidylglycerophosphatase A [Bacillota bacterium]
MKELVQHMLLERGVDLPDIAHLVLALQRPFHPRLTLQHCLDSVLAVLEKREVQYALLTGIALDRCAEQGLLPEPLQEAIVSDAPLYGIDEVLALSITNVYGTIGLTNFGYLDKIKPGILSKMNHRSPRVNTFLDDLIAGVAAAASARIAHNGAEEETGAIMSEIVGAESLC